MKLLFAIKTLATIGGAERVLSTVCSELASRRHEITVVTFNQPGSQASYPLDARIQRVDLGIGNIERSARLGETLRRILALRRVVMASKPQIAVGFMHSMFVPLALAMAGTGIPIVGSEHIVPEHYQNRPLQYILLLVSSLFLSRVTVLSRAILFRYPWAIRRRMVAIPNSVEAAIGSANPGAIKPRYVLLNVGRLDAQKDHGTLLRAFAHVTATCPGWDLKILGEGPLREELEALIRSLGIVARVRSAGVTKDIATEYRGADCFVISSRYEAFGLVTAEAMSYGLPVLGFADCPGTNELIEHNRTGLLVAPGSNRVVMLARELERMMTDPELRRRLGDAGRLEIARFASPSKVGEIWENLLGALIATPKRPG